MASIVVHEALGAAVHVSRPVTDRERAPIDQRERVITADGRYPVGGRVVGPVHPGAGTPLTRRLVTSSAWVKRIHDASGDLEDLPSTLSKVRRKPHRRCRWAAFVRIMWCPLPHPVRLSRP